MKKGNTILKLCIGLMAVIFMLGVGALPAQAEVVFSEGFESGWGLWSTDNGVWEVGTPTAGPPSCYNGSQCAGTVLSGNYPSQTDSRLVSPSITLPAVTGDEEIYFSFRQWFSYAANDGGYVQISVYDDATGTWSAWSNIGTSISDGSPVWSLKSVRAGVLTGVGGKKIRIAFYHTAASWGEPGSESTGWYIDDIEVVKKVPAFTGDFETGWGDWSADRGVWEVGTPTAGPPSCYNGSQCAGTVLSGNYPSQTDSRLVSPSIVLPAVTGGDEIHLRFWHWFSYAANDSGQVQIAVYDNTTGAWSDWANIGNPIVNNSSVWTPFDFDITAYAGKKIRIAFYHTAAFWGEPGSESTGWYIDDITISTPLVTYYCDNDIDGYISSSPSGTCTGTGCVPAGCQTVAGNDCDDNNGAINPGATEVCDGVDNDCNPGTPDGSGETWYGSACDGPDTDLCKEGIYQCTNGTQICTDNTGNNVEVCGNNLDDNCNGQIDEGCQTGADLIISALTAPLTGGAGKTITMTDTTKNQGTGTAGASTTKLYFSTDATYSAGDTYLGSCPVPSLAAGALSPCNISVTIPSVTCADTYYIIAIADAENAVSETNENNNAKNKSIKIGSDLIVSSLSAPLSAAAGSTINVTDITKNSGADATGASTTKLYLSANTAYNPWDTYLTSRPVPPLAAGATSTGITSITIPLGAPAGTYYIIAAADANGDVPETNEANNTKYKKITITP